MKKWKIYGIVITVILVLVVVGIMVQPLFRGRITEEEAQNIAYSYADVLEGDITVLSIKKDRDDREYEIRFYDDTYTYEVEVSYVSGRVTNFEKDLRSNGNINNQNNNLTMDQEEAKRIALEKVGKSNEEVTFTKIRIDRENGVTVYDVAFYDSEKEYEIHISMETGEVVRYKENYLNINSQDTSTDYIGVEKAREIVLDHAGLTSDEVIFSKVKLDVDYHLATYEIEFYYNYYEYEYEINALTGEIIKYEIDR